ALISWLDLCTKARALRLSSRSRVRTSGRYSPIMKVSASRLEARRSGAGDDLIVLTHIVSHNLTDVVGPKGYRPKHRVIVRHAERGEDALAPDEGKAFFDWWVSHELPVGSHDLAFRVDEAALRSGRVGGVERRHF